MATCFPIQLNYNCDQLSVKSLSYNAALNYHEKGLVEKIT